MEEDTILAEVNDVGDGVAIGGGVRREAVESVANDGCAKEAGGEEAELVLVPSFGTEAEERDVEGGLEVWRKDAVK